MGFFTRVSPFHPLRYTDATMYRHLPNALTVLRAVIALVFFIVLSHYRYGVGPDAEELAAHLVGHLERSVAGAA